MKVTGLGLLGLAALVAGWGGAARAQDAETHAAPAVAAALPAELTDTTYLFEIVRHLYRWQLDETDVDRLSGTTDFVFWVRLLDVTLDADDRSSASSRTSSGRITRLTNSADWR